MLASAFAVPFAENLDAAIDQMVAKLKSPKTDCIVIARITSSGTAEVYYPRFDAYVQERLVQRLSEVNQVKVIDVDVTKNILNTKFKKFKLPSDYTTYQALLKQLYETTGKTGNVILSASLIPQSESFTDSGIAYQFDLYNPNTATKIGTITGNIAMDAATDELLGITSQQPVTVTTTTQVVEAVEKPAETPVQTAPIKDAEGWYEDFSSFAVGDQLTAWGKDAFVVAGADQRHYLSSNASEKYYTNYQVRFPANFTLKFDFVGTNYEANLILCDLSDKEYKIGFGRKYGGNCFIQLPDNKESEVPGRDINTLRFEKKGYAMKVFVNGEFAQSADTSELGNLRSFKLKIPGKVQFTNFSIIPNQ